MPFNETEEGQTHSFNDGCIPPHDMPTPESVKEILKRIDNYFDETCVQDGYAKEAIKTLARTAYTAGRTSMRQDVLAVVPEKQNEDGKCFFGHCVDGMCSVVDERVNEFRSQLLTNIEGIV